MKILLVEDHEEISDFLSRRLQRRGFETVIAANGAEGVMVAMSQRPDIILLDMNMPVMDGWAAAGIMKATPITAHIPIIALTAHAMSGDEQKALEAGCNDYVSKPIDFAVLLEKIELLTGGSVEAGRAAA